MAGAELPWWAAAARWLLAAIFVATGLGKALDLPGFAALLGPYRLLPDALLLPAAIAITATEFAIAAGLAVRTTMRRAAWAGLALALVNAAALTLTLARGIALENCGCFGVFLARPLRPWTPLEDLMLAGLALAVLAGRAVRPRKVAAPC